MTATQTTSAQSSPATTSRSRTGNVALWVLQGIAALAFLLAAMGKFTGAEQIVASFEAIGFGVWFRYLIGVLEVAGAVALLVPRLSGVAALAFVGLMVGATIVQLFVVGSGVAAPLVTLLLVAVIAWGRRNTLRRQV